MAWVQVGTQTYTKTWGSAPPITCKWVVTAYRDDVTNNLKIKSERFATYVSGYFGYNITSSAWVIDSSTLVTQTIKNNTPNTWTTYSITKEFDLGANQSTSILCAANWMSNSGRTSLDARLTVPTPLIVQEEEEEELEELIGDPAVAIQLADGPVSLYPVCCYPVGTILEMATNTSPASIWPNTTWNLLTGRFLLASGNTYKISGGVDTGGEATVTLKTEHLPKHSHVIQAGNPRSGSKRHISGAGYSGTVQTVRSDSAGDGAAHDNIPLHWKVAMWERVG